jgi:hypothetical protein
VLDQAAIQLNTLTQPHRPDAYHQLKLMDGTTAPAGTFLLDIDKFRDVISQTILTQPEALNCLGEQVSQKTQVLNATKLTYSVASIVMLCEWVWYLSHALQKGRAYPANRLIMEKGTKPMKETEPAPKLNPFVLMAEETATSSDSFVPISDQSLKALSLKRGND